MADQLKEICFTALFKTPFEVHSILFIILNLSIRNYEDWNVKDKNLSDFVERVIAFDFFDFFEFCFADFVLFFPVHFFSWIFRLCRLNEFSFGLLFEFFVLVHKCRVSHESLSFLLNFHDRLWDFF